MSDKRGRVNVDPGDPVEIEIPEDIANAIEDNRQKGDPRAYQFEPWQDAVLLKYLNRFNETGLTQSGIRRVLGSRGRKPPSQSTMRKRYLELIDAQSAEKGDG